MGQTVCQLQKEAEKQQTAHEELIRGGDGRREGLFQIKNQVLHRVSEIPLKYGVDQCVGDTLCTGCIMYGQRVIAAMLDFCRDIREVSEPGAIMLNYSNPNAMATWACNKYGKVRTIGLCHGEIHGEMQKIKDWIDLSNWIHGETGGYLRVTREERNWFETDYPKILAEEPRKLDGSARGKEHASYIIEALETGKMYRGHFNVMNEGCITNLPDECVVEVPCYVDGNGISVPKVGDLPLGCAAVCSQSIWVQKLAVEAAVHGDVNLLKQAALMDPLTGAVCNPPEIWQMIDEVLVAQEEWLPQYTEAIRQAKERLQSGPLIPTKEGYRGAVRLREKTAEEVAAEHEKRKITV